MHGEMLVLLVLKDLREHSVGVFLGRPQRVPVADGPIIARLDERRG